MDQERSLSRKRNLSGSANCSVTFLSHRVLDWFSFIPSKFSGGMENGWLLCSLFFAQK